MAPFERHGPPLCSVGPEQCTGCTHSPQACWSKLLVWVYAGWRPAAYGGEARPLRDSARLALQYLRERHVLRRSHAP